MVSHLYNFTKNHWFLHFLVNFMICTLYLKIREKSKNTQTKGKNIQTWKDSGYNHAYTLIEKFSKMTLIKWKFSQKKTSRKRKTNDTGNDEEYFLSLSFSLFYCFHTFICINPSVQLSTHHSIKFNRVISRVLYFSPLATFKHTLPTLQWNLQQIP